MKWRLWWIVIVLALSLLVGLIASPKHQTFEFETKLGTNTTYKPHRYTVSVWRVRTPIRIYRAIKSYSNIRGDLGLSLIFSPKAYQTLAVRLYRDGEQLAYAEQSLPNIENCMLDDDDLSLQTWPEDSSVADPMNAEANEFQDSVVSGRYVRSFYIEDGEVLDVKGKIFVFTNDGKLHAY